MRKTLLKRSTKPMRRGKLRARGVNETSVLKEKIQSLVRRIVIERDGGCVLRDIFLPPCNGYRKDGELVLQADHLISRSNSATFADTRLIVCLCKGHHGWKSVGSNLRKQQYDEIVKNILPKERVILWDRCEKERWRAQKVDWKLEIINLERELQEIYESKGY